MQCPAFVSLTGTFWGRPVLTPSTGVSRRPAPGVCSLQLKTPNVTVTANPGEPPESIIRRFKREMIKSGVLQEAKRRQFFETTAERRKRLRELSVRRIRLANLRRNSGIP